MMHGQTNQTNIKYLNVTDLIALCVLITTSVYMYSRLCMTASFFSLTADVGILRT